MCIVKIHELDIIFINETMTKEPKQTKNKTFCSTLKKTFLIGSSKVKIFLELSVWGRINSLFYKFVILVGCQPKSTRYAKLEVTIFGMITVSFDLRIVNAFVFQQFECV